MTALTNISEEYTLKWWAQLAGVTPILPYSVAIMTSNGNDSVQGTEVSGGSYSRQSVTFEYIIDSGDGQPALQNNGTVRFEDMPSTTIVGVEIYDAAATPIRWFYGALATSRDLVAGDPVEFAQGELKIKAK